MYVKDYGKPFVSDFGRNCTCVHHQRDTMFHRKSRQQLSIYRYFMFVTNSVWIYFVFSNIYKLNRLTIEISWLYITPDGKGIPGNLACNVASFLSVDYRLSIVREDE